MPSRLLRMHGQRCKKPQIYLWYFYGWKILGEFSLHCENGPPHSKMHSNRYQHVARVQKHLKEFIFVNFSGRGDWLWSRNRKGGLQFTQLFGAFQTDFLHLCAGIHRTLLVSNSLRSPLGSHGEALVALLLLVQVGGRHHGGGQGGAVLVVHLHPVLLQAVGGAVVHQVAVGAAQERVHVVHLFIDKDSYQTKCKNYLHLLPLVHVAVDTVGRHILKAHLRKPCSSFSLLNTQF